MMLIVSIGNAKYCCHFLLKNTYHFVSLNIRQWCAFRPCYKWIGSQRKLIPEIPFIAVTATATRETQNNVIQSLNMSNAKIFEESITRLNLKLKVVPKEKDIIEQIHSIIVKDYQGQAGIIYCQKTDECKIFSAELREKGIPCASYYGSMKAKQKLANQKLWMGGNADLMIATSAFGAGIDKLDVRVIMHASLPTSIEDYVQQVCVPFC